MIHKKLTLTAVALATLALTPSFAFAESERPQTEAGKEAEKEGGPRADKFEKRGHEMFEKTDTDKDGFLSKEEMEASHKARMEEMFNRTDADQDGKLSPEELKKGRESMRDKFRQKYKDGKDGKNHAEGHPVDKPAE